MPGKGEATGNGPGDNLHRGPLNPQTFPKALLWKTHQIRIQKLNDEELCKYPGSFRITCGLFLELWSISLAFAAEEFEAKLKVMPDLHSNLGR